MWSTVGQAKVRAIAFKARRRVDALYIVAIRVAASGPLRVERSEPPPGHCTLWGAPEAIIERARVIERV